MRVISLLPVLLLTACGYTSPTWMPAGYSWHNDEYKAQPGPEADNLGYAYTPDSNEEMVAMWREVAVELVTDLETQTGLSPQPLHVQKLPGSNAFNLSLDNALRDELRARGYTLTDSSEGATQIKYQAFQTGDEKKGPVVLYNGDEEVLRKASNPGKMREFVFVLTLLQNNAAFGEVRRTRTLPAYGYVHGEGVIIPAPRLMEGSSTEAAPQE